MLARRCRAFAAAGPLVLLALVALLALSSSGTVAAYDDGQCESQVYPLDGSTLKPVRVLFVCFVKKHKAPLASSVVATQSSHRQK